MCVGEQRPQSTTRALHPHTCPIECVYVRGARSLLRCDSTKVPGIPPISGNPNLPAEGTRRCFRERPHPRQSAPRYIHSLYGKIASNNCLHARPTRRLVGPLLAPGNAGRQTDGYDRTARDSLVVTRTHSLTLGQRPPTAREAAAHANCEPLPVPYRSVRIASPHTQCAQETRARL